MQSYHFDYQALNGFPPTVGSCSNLSLSAISQSVAFNTHGANTSASVSLPDDACEAVLRNFIAEDPERAERLLRRADEQLGGGLGSCDGFVAVSRPLRKPGAPCKGVTGGAGSFKA